MSEEKVMETEVEGGVRATREPGTSRSLKREGQWLGLGLSLPGPGFNPWLGN